MYWRVDIVNYVWELAIRVTEQNVDPKTIFFEYGRPFSPYTELSFESINEKNILSVVEINPFYRYYNIFKELFEPNINENQEVIAVIHDLSIQHLKDIDILMGMNKREYYINFVINDIKNGFFGSYLKEKISLFTRAEQKIISNNILALYTTGEGIYLLKDTVSRIFKRAYIFSNAAEKDEIVFYLQTKETYEKNEQIELIKYLFLPFKCNVEIYWENIFGVIGIDDLMKIDGIINY